MRTVVTAVVVACGCWLSLTAQAQPGVDALVARVGQRVAEFYRRMQTVVCVERSTVQPIGSNWSVTNMPMARTVESDLRVEFDDFDGDPLPEARVIRDVRLVNGRPPRERDARSRAGCTDPNPLSPEPLAFLLPAHREEYRFTSIRSGSDRDRAAIIIDFQSAERRSAAELIEDERGHDDCFDWKGTLASRGRVWVDAVSDDVLKVERYLPGPVDVRVPQPLQRRYGFSSWIVLEREDLEVRYKPVRFTDPDETLLLPEEIDSTTIVRSSLQSTRRTQTFTGYRRFRTEGRIVGR